MEGTSVFEGRHTKYQCFYNEGDVHIPLSITKTSQQQVKNKEKWTRGELTEQRCRALKNSHAATLAEVRRIQACLVRSHLKQSYSKNDYTQNKERQDSEKVSSIELEKYVPFNNSQRLITTVIAASIFMRFSVHPHYITLLTETHQCFITIK
jgi:hypothetical protein